MLNRSLDRREWRFLSWEGGVEEKFGVSQAASNLIVMGPGRPMGISMDVDSKCSNVAKIGHVNTSSEGRSGRRRGWGHCLYSLKDELGRASRSVTGSIPLELGNAYISGKWRPSHQVQGTPALQQPIFTRREIFMMIRLCHVLLQI